MLGVFAHPETGIDFEGFAAALECAVNERVPVWIPGTAFAEYTRIVDQHLYLAKSLASLASSADGSVVAVGFADGTTELRTADQAKLCTLAGPQSPSTMGDENAPVAICFAPDGKTLFVNIQYPGTTVAITGPWPA